MGHPARLAVVERLGLGECCVCELLELEELRATSGPTVSQHLLVLKGAGVIGDERRGRRIYYRLRMPCVTRISLCVGGTEDELEEACCGAFEGEVAS